MESSFFCPDEFKSGSTWLITHHPILLSGAHPGGILPLEEIKEPIGLTALTCPPWDHILTDSTAEELSLEVCCGDDKLTQQGVPHIYLSTNY